MWICKDCLHELEPFIYPSNKDFIAYVSDDCEFCKHEGVTVFRLDLERIIVEDLVKDYLFRIGHIQID